MTSNVTMNSTEDSTDLREYYVGVYLGLHNSYVWVLAFLGVPGNIACVLTLTTMTVTTATVYVTLLAVTDLLALVLKLIFHQLSTHNVPLYDVGCKFSLLVEVISCLANWTLVLICFERFLAVCFPLLRNAYFTRKKAVAIAAMLGLVIFLIYLCAVVLYEWGGMRCDFQPQPESFPSYWYWVAAAIYSFLPFLLLAVLTFFIIHSLRKHFRVRRNLQEASREGMRDEPSFSRAESAICIMMVSAAIAFLLLTLPTCLYYFLLEAKVFDIENSSLQGQFAIIMFKELATELADANHAINFYIYFLTNGRFRTQFKAVLQKCCNSISSRASRNDKNVPTRTTRIDSGTAVTTVHRDPERLNAARI